MKKINNKKYTLSVILVSCIFIASNRFFYLAPLPQILAQQGSNVLLLAIVTTITFFIYLLFISYRDYGRFGKEIAILYLIVLWNAIYMYKTYDYGLGQIEWEMIPFLILLGYYPLTYLISNYGLDSFAKIVEIVSIILGIVMLTQALIYKFNGDIFLNIVVPSNFSGRFSGICDGVMRIGVLVSMYQLIKRRESMHLHILNFVISLLCIIFVDQSRIYLMSVLIGILFMVIAKDYSKRKTYFDYLIYLLSFIAILIFLQVIINSLLNTLADAYNGSNYARKYAIEYFFSQYPTHFWSGLGIVVPDEHDIYYNLITGIYGIYNYNDVGIFGLMASMGISAVIWYFWIIIKSFILTRKSKYKLLNIGLIVELLVSIFTMSYLDRGRLISLMMFLAIIGSGQYNNEQQY